MLYVSRLLDINWLVQWSLNQRCKKSKMFICRGKIQLNLHLDTSIATPNKACYIGIPLLGKSTGVSNLTIITGDAKSMIVLDGATIGRGVKLSVGPAAKLEIGDKSYITDGSQILAQNSIIIGKNCAISFGVTIMDDDGHGIGLPPYSAPITIEDEVWIGCNVTILKGVTIGKGSVVAAGAVVTKSCPPHSLLAGVPAKIIKQEIAWTDAVKLKEKF
jgi:acetyltransferase-like isoleucine patch superfamily enzyme